MASSSMAGQQARVRLPAPGTQAPPPRYTGTPVGTFPQWGLCLICNNNGNPEAAYEDKNFYVLPCLHTLCSNDCLAQLKDFVDPLACPKCKVKFSEHSVTQRVIRPMYLLDKEKVEAEEAVVNVVICTFCFRGDEGISWCTTCEEFLCQNCTDHHPHAKTTHDHKLSSDLANRKKSDSVNAVDDGLESGQAGCPTHRGQDLTTFCETCEVKLCNLCISSFPVHAEHKLSGIPQLVAEYRVELASSLKEAYTIARIAKSAEVALKEKIQHVLKTEKKYLLNEAGAQFSILLSTLMNREMAMRKEITEMTVTRAKLLNIKRAKLKSLITQASQYNKLVRDVVARTSDESLLKIRSMLRSQFRKMQTVSTMITDKSNFATYIEQGHHFMMEKQVCTSAEKHIVSVGKCTYAYNPNSRVHQKMYKSLDCIKRSASIAQAQAAASAAIAAATATTTRPPNRPPSPPQPRYVTVNRAVVNFSRTVQTNNARLGLSMQPRVVIPTPSVNGQKPDRPLQLARRSVAVKRTGVPQHSQQSSVEIRSPPVMAPKTPANENVYIIPTRNQSEESKDEGTNTNDGYDLFTMEAVEDDEGEEGALNSFGNSEEDTDSNALQIDEHSLIDSEQPEVSEVYMPYDGPEPGIDVEEMYIDEHEKNDCENLEGIEKAVAEAVNERDEIGGPEDELFDVEHEGLEEGTTAPDDVEQEMRAPSPTEDEDDEPPLLTPPAPLPLGRKTSRKAQLSAELRLEDESIEFEAEPLFNSSRKGLPVLKPIPHSTGSKGEYPSIGAGNKVIKLAMALSMGDSPDTRGESPSSVSALGVCENEAKAESVLRADLITSPGSDAPPPVISPYSDSSDLTVSGKRERKIKKIDPEFVDPDDSSLKAFRRKPSMARREPSPAKPSTLKPTVAASCDFVIAEGDSSASSSYSSEIRTKKTKKRSSGFLGRSNRKRKAGRQSLNVPAEPDGIPTDMAALGNLTLPEPKPHEELVIKFPMLKDDNMKFTNTDDNEDYCAICRDGGEDIMICCDNCPKVFHLKCHMPAVDDVPPDDWQCNWCKLKVDACKAPPPNPNMPEEFLKKINKGIMLKPAMFYTACKFLCEVFKLDECLSMRVALESISKCVKIDASLNLHRIRQRLTSGLPKPFNDAKQLILTLRKMINLINSHAPVITEEYAWIRRFQEKFDNLVSDYFPEHADLTHDSVQTF